MENLPQEIVEDILSRLPVDCLLKFRCVSKSWLSLIDSQRFIKIHLNKSIGNEFLAHHRIILNPVRSRLLKMCCWSSLLQEPISNPFEFDNVKSIEREVDVVGCCNGLVCLVQNTGKFILWNPATRISIVLPDADPRLAGIMKDVGYKFHMYGFGYDESSDDYKVFVVITLRKGPTMGRIYSHKRRSWVATKDDDSPYCAYDAGVFVSGNLHWFGDDGDDDLAIVSFDLKNETFGDVEQPCYTIEDDLPQTLGVIEGCLSVLCDYYNSHIDVWVMKDYGVKESWVNLYNISNLNVPLRRLQLRSFCRGPNGEVLVIYDIALMIYSYHPQENAFHGPLIINMDRVYKYGVYIESLVPLGPDADQESL